MTDTIETFHGSVIQHGHHNDRIYLMHLRGEANPALVAALDKMARKYGYGKIVAKIPATGWPVFRSAGYVEEARIPKFFYGDTDGLFVAKYCSAERQIPSDQADSESAHPTPVSAAQQFACAPTIGACTSADATGMASIYRHAFETYAFPIHRAEHIRQMMRQNVFYFCCRMNHEMVALAAAEIDSASQTGEMTDFVTLPTYRGMGLAYRLLGRLENEAANHGVKTAYTIARADSPGMNRVFEKTGYHYAGRLVNNTQIGGCIRSMNVWYRPM
jgi:putative beta-lysine N-acetyltransferase